MQDAYGKLFTTSHIFFNIMVITYLALVIDLYVFSCLLQDFKFFVIYPSSSQALYPAAVIIKY